MNLSLKHNLVSFLSYKVPTLLSSSTAGTWFVQNVMRELLRVWSCVVTWRVWHSTTKAIYLNLTLDGQLWVESCGTDVVGGKLGPSGTAGVLSHHAGLVASWSSSRWAGRPWSGFAFIPWPVCATNHIWYTRPRVPCDVVLLMITGCRVCVCVRWVIFPGMNGITQVCFLTLSASCNPFLWPLWIYCLINNIHQP